MFSQDDIREFRALKRRTIIEDKGIFENIIAEQIHQEKEHLLKYTNSHCSGIKSIPLPYEFDFKKLSKKMSTEFYNPHLIQYVACTAETIYLDRKIVPRDLVSEEIMDLKLHAMEHLQQFIHETHQHKKNESFETVVGAETSLFDVKMNPNLNEARHETFVAFYGTNALRNRGILNFQYIYGLLMCPSPGEMPTTSIIPYQPCENHVAWIVRENIGTHTYRQFCNHECTLENFLWSQCHIVAALQIANEEFNWTHYDLHYENIIMRPINPDSDVDNFFNGDIYVNLSHSNKSRYGRTRQYIPTFTNYNVSHIKYSGHNYGTVRYLLKEGVSNNKPSIISDCHKILMFGLLALLESGNSHLNELLPLISYFVKDIHTNEELLDYLKRGYDNLYMVPSNVTNFNVENWLNHLRSFLKEKNLTDPIVDSDTLTGNNSVKILTCTGSCVSYHSIEDSFPAESKAIPTTVVDFYLLNNIYYDYSLTLKEDAAKYARENNSTLSKVWDAYLQYKNFYKNPPRKLNASELEDAKNKVRESESEWERQRDFILQKHNLDHDSQNNVHSNNMDISDSNNIEYIHLVEKYRQSIHSHMEMYENFKTNITGALERETHKLSDLFRYLEPFDIYDLPPPSDLLSRNILEVMKKYVNRVSLFWESYSRIKLSLKGLGKINSIYHNPDSQRIYDGFSPKFAQAEVFAKALKTITIQDATKIRENSEYEIIHQMVSPAYLQIPGTDRWINNPYYHANWYWTIYPMLDIFE